MKGKIRILREINKNPGINQRALSSECKISLGKVNTIVDSLEMDKLIVKEIKGRQYKYSITKKGLIILENEIKDNKEVQLELHSEKIVPIKTAVILAAGRNKNFDKPVGNLEINNLTLLERNIHILRYNGIEKIIIVIGYKGEEIKNKLNDNNIIFVENSNFKWTGTMSSLVTVENNIDEDFILLESDIVIEESGIRGIINYPCRDCVLITTESGSGDEAFVEIKDNKIYKISKDIAQLNKIDGEMIGVSKISLEFFEKMMQEYKFNKNPYMNYEYMMLDISRTYSLGYIKIDNLLWHEIDNNEHYYYVNNILLKKIDKKEKSIYLENLKGIIYDSMKVSPERINNISPIGGMTNKNYKIEIDNECYVLRVPGNGTGEMISREDEIRNAVYANEVGVDSELLYFNEKSGIKISRFIENAETLSPEATKKQNNMIMVCDILRKLHNYNRKMANNFDIYGKIEQYENLANEVNAIFFDDYYEVKDKVLLLKNIIAELDVKLAPCHNDTIAENFIKSGEDKMYLIDWEYAGMNDPMWDLAAHSLENKFSEDEEELLLNIYFNGKVEEKYKKRILINKIYQDFLWSTWTIIKEAKGDDFGSYGIDRYTRAKKNLEIILKEGL
ncbi:phosphocholine cytidylyltransferase/choline kinase family protein [uncultured Clostridium sp.]|uniref:phosphocholine cytidylyltransferase/choline kinase family protein n=1 Tax=uncultured Clostridium sp. TaxID=59620 RepID=UPI0025D3D158|nr:phosphocholine cytidylyltransferase/choline kinase family protein [uncultured Clostridium sp.]MDU4884554.1 phosphocholine cytidylyltransferase/choline kinase family protein [Clostridium celatum]MDU7077723.1 phosphocholine cytidylyltransferase/choline kinase family protein [Clostridium celatum]